MSYSIRDSQRSKVYKWERALRGPAANDISAAEARRMVTQIWQCYYPTGSTCSNGQLHRPAPTLKASRAKRSFSTFYPGDWEIRVAASWGLSKVVVCHEVAHAIVREWFRFDHVGIQPHGPEFVGVLIDLLSEYAGIGHYDARKLASQCGVRCRFTVSTAQLAEKPAASNG